MLTEGWPSRSSLNSTEKEAGRGWGGRGLGHRANRATIGYVAKVVRDGKGRGRETGSRREMCRESERDSGREERWVGEIRESEKDGHRER